MKVRTPGPRAVAGRLVAVVTAALALAAVGQPGASGSESGICSKLGQTARCRISFGSPPSNGGGGGGGGGTGEKPKPLCNTGPPDYHGVSCSSTTGIWSNEEQCYLGENTDEISTDDPAWGGHTDGKLYDCIGQHGENKGTRWFAQPPTLAGWDPQRMMEKILGIEFVAFPVGIAPSAKKYESGNAGIVGAPVWMWAADRFTGNYADPPIEVREPGTPFFLRAATTHTFWDMGDGTTKKCGAGTPYAPYLRLKESPDCGHRYTEPGIYRVTIRTHWRIEWQDVNGGGGKDLEFTRSTLIRVYEAQTVTK